MRVYSCFSLSVSQCYISLHLSFHPFLGTVEQCCRVGEVADPSALTVPVEVYTTGVQTAVHSLHKTSRSVFITEK